MNRPFPKLPLGALLAMTALVVSCASTDAAPPASRPKPTAAPTWTGTASGTFTVGGDATPLKFAYAVVVRPRRAAADQTHVVLAAEPIPLETLDDLLGALPRAGVRCVQVSLDDQGKPLSAFFHHDNLPRGLEVTELTRLVPAKAAAGRIAGRLTFVDPGFSWSFDAEFDAPVYRPARKASAADAPGLTKEQRAKALLAEQHLEVGPQGLRSAILDGDVETVKLQLDAGVPATSGEPEWGALYDAVEQGDLAIVELLLARGANPNGTDHSGQPLLHQAASDKEPAVVKALIDAGADVNARAGMNQTALMLAAGSGRKEKVDLLLAAGAKVTARRTDGWTALHSAVFAGHLEIVKTLIAAGADVARDRKELLGYARSGKHKEIEKAILDAGKAAPKPAPKKK